MFLANLKDNYSFSTETERFLTSQIRLIINSAGGNISEFLFIDSSFEGTAQELDKYKNTVRSLFATVGCNLTFISDSGDPAFSIDQSKAIAVGGGSLQKLSNSLSTRIKGMIMNKVKGGIPYVGFNAGSVFASPASIDASPTTIDCVNAVPFQYYSNYRDSQVNRDILQTFLIEHKTEPAKIKYITAMTSAPDGSGIRMEDDDAGLALPDSLVEPMFLFTLDQNDQIKAEIFNPDDLNIILTSPVD